LGALKSGIEGISMFGEAGTHHVNNEINYSVANPAFLLADSLLLPAAPGAGRCAPPRDALLLLGLA
ncbi:MAG: hypothetical protein QGF67_18630, partial [Lentisphaeria bacterium]|nr:hypothetical protein [Lentisphaeria bacterium]